MAEFHAVAQERDLPSRRRNCGAGRATNVSAAPRGGILRAAKMAAGLYFLALNVLKCPLPCTDKEKVVGIASRHQREDFPPHPDDPTRNGRSA